MHPFEVWMPTCCVAYGLLTQKCIYLVCSRLNVETRPERPIDIKVWQKVRENLVFCRVCCCISRLDNRCSPQHFGINKSVMLFFFPIGLYSEKQVIVQSFSRHVLLDVKDPPISTNYLDKCLFFILNFKVLRNKCLWAVIARVRRAWILSMWEYK